MTPQINLPSRPSTVKFEQRVRKNREESIWTRLIFQEAVPCFMLGWTHRPYALLWRSAPAHSTLLSYISTEQLSWVWTGWTHTSLCFHRLFTVIICRVTMSTVLFRRIILYEAKYCWSAMFNIKVKLNVYQNHAGLLFGTWHYALLISGNSRSTQDIVLEAWSRAPSLDFSSSKLKK